MPHMLQPSSASECSISFNTNITEYDLSLSNNIFYYIGQNAEMQCLPEIGSQLMLSVDYALSFSQLSPMACRLSNKY